MISIFQTALALIVPKISDYRIVFFDVLYLWTKSNLIYFLCELPPPTLCLEVEASYFIENCL